MRRPVIRVFTVVAVLFALIFSQLWIAAYACASVVNVASPDPAVLIVSASSHSDLGDHQTGVACHAHCDNSAQPDHAGQPTPPPLVWLPLIWGHSAVFALAIRPHLPARSEPILLSAPPPPRILFQVFRT